MGGKQSVPKISSQDRAIVDLKIQRDEVKRYRKRIQIVLDREQAIAKEALANGNKRVALLALRKRKYQESMLQKTDGQLETLEGWSHLLNSPWSKRIFSLACNKETKSSKLSMPK
ncbi:SNF7 family protein [Rhizoctonia solani AG-3 Rhs1AP]|uniref:SNF7 family protein n=1 Tax=Rhizoctonia solani AG-3 Rhs1AP TaxID=1086054 RepID=X8J2Z7_9AGAM|nr:SNF7 family protein [Rhizoctonia solani AG-3 Rhs1AP]